jgi:hypothetical protein
VFFVKIGTRAEWQANIRSAIRAGFDHLVRTIEPPILQHVTNPLTLERGYAGKDMPIVTYDLEEEADYIEIVCSPKALGSGRWAAMELFTFPSLDTIETYILDVAIKAGSQHCPPVVMGVGIGGTFDYCAKLAKQATLRPLGTVNEDATLADDGRAPLRCGQCSRLRPDGNRRRYHGAWRSCRLCRRARLHARRGLLQLLDQPQDARTHLQRRPHRKTGVAAHGRATHASGYR